MTVDLEKLKEISINSFKNKVKKKAKEAALLLISGEKGKTLKTQKCILLKPQTTKISRRNDQTRRPNNVQLQDKNGDNYSSTALSNYGS